MCVWLRPLWVCGQWQRCYGSCLSVFMVTEFTWVQEEDWSMYGENTNITAISIYKVHVLPYFVIMCKCTLCKKWLTLVQWFNCATSWLWCGLSTQYVVYVVLKVWVSISCSGLPVQWYDCAKCNCEQCICAIGLQNGKLPTLGAHQAAKQQRSVQQPNMDKSGS